MSVYNDDELVAPSWVNQEFFEKVLSQYENKENVEIISFDVTPASMKGDHYASIMLRCKVCYKLDKSASSKQKLFIVKTLPDEDNMKREILMHSELFETEINMYCKTLPKIEKILAESGEPTKLKAEIIYHALEPHKVIVFEDLCEAGYDVLRGRYLNENEMKAIYKKLAKLHAVSYMLGHSENHEVVTKYQKGLFKNTAIMTMDMMTNGIDHFIEMLSGHKEFEIYLEKFKALKPDLHKKCLELFDAYNLENNHGDIFVLNHGDFHMKNLMFKFNKQKQLDDLIMVDYQICCYAPSNLDIIGSQYLMLSPELRLRVNELRQYYFKEFIRVLKKINYQGVMPKFSEFQIAGIKYRHWSAFIMASFLPMVRGIIVSSVDDLKDVDMKAMVENYDSMKSVYHHPDFLEDIRNVMPIMLREGYLD